MYDLPYDNSAWGLAGHQVLGRPARTIRQARRVPEAVDSRWHQTGSQKRVTFLLNPSLSSKYAESLRERSGWMVLPRPARSFLTSPLSRNCRFVAITPDVRSAVGADARPGTQA